MGTAYNKLIGGFIICGIVGFTNFNSKITKEESNQILSNMNKKIKKIGQEETLLVEEKICIGHNRVMESEDNNEQPVICRFQDNKYLITCTGRIYNSLDLRKKLIDNGFKFDGDSDTEVLAKGFMFYGYEILKHLNGVFAIVIWNENKQELFLARDHFGVKPLFYAIKNNELIFSSEIKALFEFPSIYPSIDATGISELFGIGPAHTPGTTLFKDIKEVKPSSYIIFNKNYLVKEKYWKLTSIKHNDSFNDTCNKVEYLLRDSIEKQCASKMPLGTFLSGGLDSSIITFYAKEHLKNEGNINTFSVDYRDNDKNFKKSDFQPNSDNDYIDFASEQLNTNHRIIELDTPELAEKLYDAMIARDLPGMADVDASLLLLCKRVKPYIKIALTGECADEIFAGYPWFFRDDSLKSNTFPWSINIEDRQKMINTAISKKIDLKNYIDERYKESLSEVDFDEFDSKDTTEKKKISYLTMNWFMQTLLDRSERMATTAGIEIRVPFCDYRIAEYLWNIPWEVKAYNGREKGLLRYIMKGKLPDKIVERKKSPYPKTWNPTYTEKVKSMLIEVMEKHDAPIKRIIDENEIYSIIKTNGNRYSRPWFGQLMTGPQLMAYLCQINMWLEEYQPRIEV